MASELASQVRRGGWIAVRWSTAAWAVMLAGYCLARNRLWFYDDAFITLRYARHLAEGLGPVWNRTGTPVEGFSSPLHLLLVTGLLLLHVDPIVALRGISLAFHAMLVGHVWSFMRRSSGSEAGVIAAALVAASWPLLVWDLGGLDAVPFSALLSIGTLVELRYVESGRRRDAVMGGALLGLAILMRPDGAVVAAIAFGACLVAGRWNLWRRGVDIGLGIVLCMLMVLPWEIFRASYYHSFLPNTYYAKIYGVPLLWRVHSGLIYWRVYLTKAPYFSLIIPIALLALIYERKAARFDVALWACIAGYGLYLLYCGGDHMLAFRFMTPIIPLLIVSLVRALAQLGALRTPVLAAAVSAALLVAMARQATVSLQNPEMGDSAGMAGAEAGHLIDSQWKAGSIVALNVAGATPYFADRLNYIDMLGLNDEFIAGRHPVPVDGPWVKLIGHVKGDGASVLGRRPDYIILGGPLGAAANSAGPQFFGDYELTRLPGFSEQYVECQMPLELTELTYRQFEQFFPVQPVPFTYYKRRDLSAACPTPVSAKGQKNF